MESVGVRLGSDPPIKLTYLPERASKGFNVGDETNVLPVLRACGVELELF